MLKDTAYSTADRLASFMNLATPTGVQKTVMESIINGISSFIDEYTSRHFNKIVHTRETIDTERGQLINLPAYPVIDTEPFILEKRNSQLNEDKWQVIDPLYYDVDEETGIIQLLDGVYVFRGRKVYRVTWTSGYDFNNSTTFLGDTEAGDVEVALWLIGQDVWKNKGVASNIYSEKIGDYAITYQRPTKGSNGYAFDNAQAISLLEKYVDVAPVGVLTPLQSI